MKKIFMMLAVAFTAVLLSCGGKQDAAADPIAAYEKALTEYAEDFEKNGQPSVELGMALDEARAAAKAAADADPALADKFSEMEGKFWEVMTPILNAATEGLGDDTEAEEAPADTTAEE